MNKIVIFTKFKRFAHILHRELKEYNPLLLTGDTTNRAELITLWQTDDKYKIFISTEAGAEGITLSPARYLINCDLPYSIGKYVQRLGRIGGLRATKNYFVYNLMAKVEGKQTIDGWVKKKLWKKMDASEQILAVKELLT